MKKQLILAVAICTTVLVGCKQSADETAAKPMALDTEAKRVGYGMGIGLGKRLHSETMQIDADAFAEGIKTAMKGEKPLMTDEEINKEIQAFQKKRMAERQQAMEKEAKDNKTKGEVFLAENAKKEGVHTTKSGLQYKVLTEGKGPIPKPDDIVEVNYRGTLIDGKEFDSSYKRGSSVTFPVNGVIPGWTEALQLMPVGSKWELYIPSDLAYGPGGTGGGPIGPNATLVFDVELLGIKNKDAKGGDDAKPKAEQKQG